MAKNLYDVGDAPPLGEVPPKMHAWLVRPDRFSEPTQAWQQEVIDVPEIGDDEVLVYVMAAGINYNNVWAGLGMPVDVIGARQRAGEPEEFHVGGSDASGIVYKVRAEERLGIAPGGLGVDLMIEETQAIINERGVRAVFTPKDSDLNGIMAELVDVLRLANDLEPLGTL